MTDLTRHVPEVDLHELMDGRLDAARREEIEMHVAGCPSCRRALDGLRDARTALGRMRPIDVPLDLPQRVREALDQEAGRTGTARRFGVRVRPALAWSALAVVLLGLALYRLLPRDDVSALTEVFENVRQDPASLAKVTSDTAESAALLRRPPARLRREGLRLRHDGAPPGRRRRAGNRRAQDGGLRLSRL